MAHSDQTFARFEIVLAIRPEDIDRLGHVNNIVYLRWVQEAATAHWRAAATELQVEEFIWVVVRHEIDYLAPAMPGDILTARTYVGEAKGAKFDRHVEILRKPDDALIARARSVWVALDSRTSRPRRVPAELIERFKDHRNQPS